MPHFVYLGLETANPSLLVSLCFSEGGLHSKIDVRDNTAHQVLCTLLKTVSLGLP